MDRFAKAMKDKLVECRAKGRSGWHDPLLCTGGELRRLLRNAIIKGDPVDVGNLAMMLHQRQDKTCGESLETTPPEGILHHALRDQMARDAAEGLRAIEEQQAKRERRIAEEQRREVDRRGIPADAVLVHCGNYISVNAPAYPRSDDMANVADAERSA